MWICHCRPSGCLWRRREAASALRRMAR